HEPIELSIVAEVDGAEATRPQGVPHLITAEGRGWDRDTPRPRGRADIRTWPKPRQQRPYLRVDELELLPPLPDFGEQLGTVAAHLLRRLAQFEHLLEQSEHLRVAGHVQSLLKLLAKPRQQTVDERPLIGRRPEKAFEHVPVNVLRRRTVLFDLWHKN